MDDLEIRNGYYHVTLHITCTTYYNVNVIELNRIIGRYKRRGYENEIGFV